jgi:hypothetical protein
MLKAEKRNYAKLFTRLYLRVLRAVCPGPVDAIIMMKSLDMSTPDRREMLLDKDRLHAIGLQHEASWATGNRPRVALPRKKAGSRKPRGRRKREGSGARMTGEVRLWLFAALLAGAGSPLSKNLFHSVLWLALVATLASPDARRGVPRRPGPPLRGRRRHGGGFAIVVTDGYRRTPVTRAGGGGWRRGSPRSRARRLAAQVGLQKPSPVI